MVWSPSCYPNTNKQRRNIGVNDRGGGVEACPKAGGALHSPGALKSEGPVRVTHTSRPRSGRDSHAVLVSSPNFFPSFHKFLREVVCMAT